MSNTLELSYLNANVKNSTSDWVNCFQPITINSGDTLSFSQGFLDYGSSADNNIELIDDVEVSISAGFYYNTSNPQTINTNIDYNNNKKVTFYKPFVARDDNRDLIESTRNFVIPKGVYDATQLAESINRELTVLNIRSVGTCVDFVNHQDTQFFRMSTNDICVCEIFSIQWANGNECIITPTLYNQYQMDQFNINDNVNLVYQDTSAVYTWDGIVKTKQPTYIMFEVLGAHEADRTDYNAILSKINLPPVKFFDPYDPDPNLFITLKDSAYFGASQISLLYNDDNNGSFSWKYIHTPAYHDFGGTYSECVIVQGFNANVFNYINAQTGIFFTNIEPASFWEDILGFDLEKLIVVDNQATHVLNKELLLGTNITGNIVSNDSLFDKGSSTKVVNGVNYLESDQTFDIIADYVGKNSTVSSNFIVQVSGLGNSNMIDDKNSYQSIAQVVSKEYNSNGIITVYGDGTTFYQNTGEPFVLTSLNVRILDGITKSSSSILGENNSIFLKINKSQ